MKIRNLSSSIIQLSKVALGPFASVNVPDFNLLHPDYDAIKAGMQLGVFAPLDVEAQTAFLSLLPATTATATGESVAVYQDTNVDVRLSGTGALSSTIVIEGSNDRATSFTTLNTLTLSGTDNVTQSIYVSYQYAFLRVRVTAISGTSATVTASLDPASRGTVVASTRKCVGSQVIEVTPATVVTLTPSQHAVAAMIQADGSSVSVTLDGTTPSATTGLRVDDGVILNLDSSLSTVKMIARSANTYVQVLYFDKP